MIVSIKNICSGTMLIISYFCIPNQRYFHEHSLNIPENYVTSIVSLIPSYFLRNSSNSILIVKFIWLQQIFLLSDIISKSIFHSISLSNKITGFTELSILLNYSILDFVNLLALNLMHLIVVEFNLSRFLGILELFVFHIFIPAWSRGEHRVDRIVSEGLLTF